MPSSKKALDWALRLVPAAILGQTLFFKFSGAPESVYIFTKLGIEPLGRYASGTAEALACLLLLLPAAPTLGAALGLAVMLGAIASHLGPLGIQVMGDHGLLFGLACVTAVCCEALLWLRKGELPALLRRLLKRG